MRTGAPGHRQRLAFHLEVEFGGVRGESVMGLRTARSIAVGVVAGGCCMLAGGVAGAAPLAHTARTVTVTDTAHLHLVKKSGATLDETGTATGSIPGTVKARFTVAVVLITGSVTIYPHGGGSFTIKALGVPVSTGTKAKFGGSLTIVSGTGRYAHAHGSGTFSGVIDRRTDAATVHANGRLSY